MRVEATVSTAERIFILDWADDKYVVGHQLASVTGHYGPDLEENLALGSIAQDHLGHARALYRWLAPTDEQVDRLVFLRPPAEYRTSLLAAAWEDRDWAFVATKGLLYAHAELLRAEAVWQAGRGAPRDFAEVVLRDDAVHRDHWRQWLDVLGRSPDGAARVADALRRVWPLAGEFFHESAWREAPAAIGGPTPPVGELRRRWVERAGADLRALGLEAPSDAERLTLEAERLAEQGLCGRLGRHSPEFVRMLDEAHAVFRSDPAVRWG
jgi:ring-1,2-phenylacetyl-CoA epoxidase subunit PaaC